MTDDHPLLTVDVVRGASAKPAKMFAQGSGVLTSAVAEAGSLASQALCSGIPRLSPTDAASVVKQLSTATMLATLLKASQASDSSGSSTSQQWTQLLATMVAHADEHTLPMLVRSTSSIATHVCVCRGCLEHMFVSSCWRLVLGARQNSSQLLRSGPHLRDLCSLCRQKLGRQFHCWMLSLKQGRLSIRRIK